MCDPMTALAVASAAATVGGGVMKSNEAASNTARAITAKNEAAARNVATQNQLQGEANNVFASTLKPFQDEAPKTSLNTSQAADASTILANAPGQTALAAGATTGNAPKVVQSDEGNSIASRLGKINQYGANLGNLTGYDSQNQGVARNLQDSRLKIGTVGDFARTDANVGAAQMGADVANSQKAPSPFGDLLEGAGQLGGFYAGKNGAFSNLFKKPPGLGPTPTMGAIY